MKKYHIETYGCEMNKAESAAMEATLREHGWERSPEEDAQLVLLNTCTVRATAENRAWNRIHQLSARKKERAFVLAVVGCMAEQHKGAIQKKAPGVDYVLGTFQKQSFGLMLDIISKGQRIEVLEETPTYVFDASHHEPGAFRSFVPIMHGCNNFCSYCILPLSRGGSFANPADILHEIDQLEIWCQGYHSLGKCQFLSLGGRWPDIEFSGTLENDSRTFGQQARDCSSGACGPTAIQWAHWMDTVFDEPSQGLVQRAC